jgi:AbrB family looped-hinge helix DNA binding protein
MQGKRQRARLTRQGQITVPKAIRDALGARPGDDIEFISRDGALVLELRKRRSVLDFAGIAADVAHRIPSDAEELDRVIEQGMAAAAVERDRRVRRDYRPPS